MSWIKRVYLSLILLMIALLALLLGGCGANLPSAAQIELNLPANVRTCPALPRSPGAQATNRQTAIYIVRLHSAAKRCGANMEVVNRLYSPYKAKVQQIAKGG